MVFLGVFSVVSRRLKIFHDLTQKLLVYKLVNTMITMATMWMLTGDRTYEHDIVDGYW